MRRGKAHSDFVAGAKANPGKMRVGTPGEGTSSHLNLEEFMRVAGIKLTHVPYRGWAESSPAVLGGHIEAIVAQPGEAKPFVDAKKMRALVVFQESRHPGFRGRADGEGARLERGERRVVPADGAQRHAGAAQLKYIHDAAKAAIEDPAFARQHDFTRRRRRLPARRQAACRLWREYRAHTEILKRIGMVK